MEFSVQREDLLVALKQVVGVIEQRQILPILSHVLLEVDGVDLQLVGTNSEVEIAMRMRLAEPASRAGQCTVSGRKLFDLCRALPESAQLKIARDQNTVVLRAHKSRFVLQTLPCEGFPRVEWLREAKTITFDAKHFRALLGRTLFAVAQQDVRYFLNGLLLEVSEGQVKMVGSDGHRLAVNTMDATGIDSDFTRVIVPRRAAVEMEKILSDAEDDDVVDMQISDKHLCLKYRSMTFVSSILVGTYPDYKKILPQGGDKVFQIEAVQLKQVLTRVAILASDKFKGVRLALSPGVLLVRANNAEQEAAHEEVSIAYEGETLEVGFNLAYLFDVLVAIGSGVARFTLIDADSGVLLEDADRSGDSLFVVMPIRI